MAQDLVKRRLNAASVIAAQVAAYIDAANALTETIAQLVASGGDFAQTDLDGTSMAYLDSGKLNYLRDQVWPKILAAHDAPFDGVAGHESNISMLRAIVRIKA